MSRLDYSKCSAQQLAERLGAHARRELMDAPPSLTPIEALYAMILTIKRDIEISVGRDPLLRMRLADLENIAGLAAEFVNKEISP